MKIQTISLENPLPNVLRWLGPRRRWRPVALGTPRESQKSNRRL